MSNYSINDLEKLSGIKAHTLRIWEKRYGLLSPKRTSTNIRYYDDDDLKRLLNIAFLNRNGVKISKIAQASREEITSKVSEVMMNRAEISQSANDEVDSMVVAMIDLDELKFVNHLDFLSQRYSFEEVMRLVIYPFLEKIGVLWQVGTITPAQEHFISNLIRQKLIVAIDSVGVELVDDESRVFVLFLREGELHELGLLFYSYLLKSRGEKVVYLGQSVPFEDLKQVVKIHDPDFLLTSFISPLALDDYKDYVNKLNTNFPSLSVLLTGAYALGNKIENLENVHVLTNMDDLDHLI